MTLDTLYVRPSERQLNLFRILAGIGGFAFAAGIFLMPQRMWAYTLLAGMYLLGLGLGGLFFVALQYVTGAHWSIALRRVPEAMASTIPLASVLVGVVMLFGASLYPWPTAPEEAGFRHLWLNRPFFIGRTVFYLLVWSGFAYTIIRHSRQQDKDGDPDHTRRNTRLSAGFIVVFALTFWLAAIDWIMSLESEWYSTMFGVYNFAGLFLSGLAAIVLLTVSLQRSAPFHTILTEAHLHDLGKLLFGFSTFWMYIWFCQYMLIWYANIPEETGYFVRRLHGAWLPLFLLNPVLNWVIPFFVLLSIRSKRNPDIMRKIALLILVGRWLDLYLMIMPSVGDRPVLGVWEIGTMVGAAGLFCLVLLRALRQAPAVPARDPFLAASLHHHG